MENVSLVFQETVTKTQMVPWDYDVYDIQVAGQSIGGMVYRYGTKAQLQYCGHIGYHIDESYRGHGYAYQALCLLEKVLSAKGIDHVRITCEKNNIPSKKTIEKLQVKTCYLEKNIKDEEFSTPDGLWIYEIEVRK